MHTGCIVPWNLNRQSCRSAVDIGTCDPVTVHRLPRHKLHCSWWHFRVFPGLNMPTQSALSDDDKNKVKAAIQLPYKIIFATLARVYYAHPNPNRWSYSGLQGGLALLRDNTRNVLFLRLVDLEGTRGVVWEHEVYEGFEYFQDRTFFHSFAGDVRFSTFELWCVSCSVC